MNLRANLLKGSDNLSHGFAARGLSHAMSFASAQVRIDVSGVLDDRTNRFNANTQGCINLALAITLFPYLCH